MLKLVKPYFSINSIDKTDLEMELRQLKYFIKAKELLNFTDAAKHLFISQSTLSQQIKQLEDEIGIPLFNRVGKRISLTEAGELFSVYAERSILAANDGQLMINDLGDLKKGTLRIGLTWGLKSLVLSAFKEFRVFYPDIQIQIIFGTTDELIEELIKQKIDFVLTFYDDHEEDILEYEPIFVSEMVLIVSENSPLSSLESIALKQIETLKLVLPIKGFSTREFLDKVLKKNGVKGEISVEINDTSSLLDFVKMGELNTILTRAAIYGFTGIKAIPIRDINLKRQAVIIKLKDAYEKKAALGFKSILVKINKDAYDYL